jgi:hypothetical protein
MTSLQPKRPAHLSPYAEACLQALADQELSSSLSLGGALGLLHYLDYRTTNDVDVWWTDDATSDVQKEVLNVLETTLSAFGRVRTRRWGDVVSVDLQQEGRTIFSFQVARRSAQLRPSLSVPWLAVLVDDFADLVASKMVALVERGAPRDFRDIFAICHAGLTTPGECWQWWRRRQAAAGSDFDDARGALAVQSHLSRVEQHRPLAQINDPEERRAAEQLRSWFKETFLSEQHPNG